MNEFVYYDEIAQSLAHAVYRGSASLDVVPGLLELIIKQEMWRKRISSISGQVVVFDSFADFVTSLPPEGLGTTVEVLEHLCSDDPKLVNLIREVFYSNKEMKPHSKPKRQTQASKTTFNPNSPTQTARSLKKHMTKENLKKLLALLSTTDS